MLSSSRDQSFSRLSGVEISVKIIDVGANPIDGNPPYAPMLSHGHASVVGFEPNPSAYAKLIAAKGPEDIYIQAAAGDGEEHTLHICAAPGMTSLLEPDPAVLNLMHGFPIWGHVTGTEMVKTVRLADLPAAQGADMLKIDVQGAELMVMQNAGAVLDGLVVIQTEVEFLPLYKDQPLFCDVQTFLRSQGFVFHRFEPLVSRMITPLSTGGSPYAGLSQTVWADAIFIRDFHRLANVPTSKLVALAAVMHDCYQSYDIVMHVLDVADRRDGTQLAPTYLQNLKSLAVSTSVAA